MARSDSKAAHAASKVPISVELREKKEVFITEGRLPGEEGKAGTDSANSSPVKGADLARVLKPRKVKKNERKSWGG